MSPAPSSVDVCMWHIVAFFLYFFLLVDMSPAPSCVEEFNAFEWYFTWIPYDICVSRFSFIRYFDLKQANGNLVPETESVIWKSFNCYERSSFVPNIFFRWFILIIINDFNDNSVLIYFSKFFIYSKFWTQSRQFTKTIFCKLEELIKLMLKI